MQDMDFISNIILTRFVQSLIKLPIELKFFDYNYVIIKFWHVKDWLYWIST